MKGKWMLLGVAAVVVVGIGWLVLDREAGDGHSAVPCSTFCGSARSEADQRLVDAVMESPETLDQSTAKDAKVHEKREGAGEQSAVPVCTLPTGKQRHLLSDVEKPPEPQPLKVPVAADSLRFRKEYASLRSDAIRNPNSPENRAGVVSLMQARQRRLGQK